MRRGGKPPTTGGLLGGWLRPIAPARPPPSPRAAAARLRLAASRPDATVGSRQELCAAPTGTGPVGPQCVPRSAFQPPSCPAAEPRRGRGRRGVGATCGSYAAEACCSFVGCMRQGLRELDPLPASGRPHPTPPHRTAAAPTVRRRRDRRGRGPRGPARREPQGAAGGGGRGGPQRAGTGAADVIGDHRLAGHHQPPRGDGTAAPLAPACAGARNRSAPRRVAAPGGARGGSPSHTPEKHARAKARLVRASSTGSCGAADSRTIQPS